MKFQDKHKQFAVKSFTKLMTRVEVVNAFIREFPDDLPKPSPPTTRRSERAKRPTTSSHSLVGRSVVGRSEQSELRHSSSC